MLLCLVVATSTVPARHFCAASGVWQKLASCLQRTAEDVPLPTRNHGMYTVMLPWQGRMFLQRCVNTASASVIDLCHHLIPRHLQ
jgi:hypothetical protein